MASTAAVEDRTYLRFLIAGLALALGGGFVLAVMAPLSATGVLPFQDRTHLLIQAHAFAQLLGFAGVIVAGMALRLIPRFAGVAPPDARLAGLALALLGSSALGRIVVQPWLEGTAGDLGMLASGFAGSAGMVLVAVLLWSTVRRARKPAEPWRDFVRAGIAWWLVWAIFSAAAAVEAAGNDRFVPLRLEDAVAWIAMLGVIGSFVWAVQSRSVAVFFGRKPRTRRQTIIPLVLFNGGLALVVLSVPMAEGSMSWRTEGLGLALAGVSMLWLAPAVGAVWGHAERLRPRARPAARYIIVANLAAASAGALLIWAGLTTLLSGEYQAFWARDAARHLVALGTITMLIVGMAQLVAPVFALERGGSRRARIRDEAMFWFLTAALVTRAAAGLLEEWSGYESRMNHSAYAGMLAWIGLALFAWRLASAIRREPEMKDLLGVPR
ncbi:MAG: NnrS family protein [Dehalococcoidia bacterium]